MSSVRLSGLSTRSVYSAPSYSTPRRGTSVYGGAGGANVRVSSSSLGSGFNLSHALTGGDTNNFSVTGDEKATMQNLNDRLASYLDKVRTLESANAQLVRQIDEWQAKQTPTARDYSKYMVIIDDLRSKIKVASLENNGLILEIDNCKLAAEDFKMKYEQENGMIMSMEADIIGLRRLMDELTMARSDLEMQVEGLKEELIFLKKNHEEELAALRHHTKNSSVDVQVEAKPQEDLSSIMNEIRTQYEGIVDKNRREMETWYKVKFEELNKDLKSRTEIIQTSRNEVADLKRTLQTLEIELQSELSRKSAMEACLLETEGRYSQKLQNLQNMVNSLELELTQLKRDIQSQAEEYQLLLDIKTRLEMEIAEYRRLLDGEEVPKAVIEVKVEEKRKPVITQRTKVVIEELVDGKVVSRTEDVDTEIISK